MWILPRAPMRGRMVLSDVKESDTCSIRSPLLARSTPAVRTVPARVLSQSVLALAAQVDPGAGPA